MKITGYLIAAVGLALTLYLIAHLGIDDVLHSFALAGWGLLLLIPLRVATLGLDVMGWRLLLAPFDPERRARPIFLLWVANVREAVSRLLPVASVGADLLGARLAAQRGVPMAAAGASVAVEILTSAAAQYLLTVLAVVLLAWLTQTGDITINLFLGLLCGLPVLAVLALLLHSARPFERLAAIAQRALGTLAFLPRADSAAALDRHIRRLTGDPWRLLIAMIWQFAGVLFGSAELLLASYLIDQPMSLTTAIALEGLIQGVRYLAFFVPGGLGVQEASFIFFGQLLGISGDVALALSLIRRVRELMIGLPMLLSWQWMEIHQARRRAHRTAESVRD